MHIGAGPWDRQAVEAFLSTSVIPLRVASIGADGPLVQSIWFVYDDDALWGCTQAEAVLARRLAREPRCGFEVAADDPPYRGVRGQGTVTILPDRAADVLPRLLERYQGTTRTGLGTWLLSRLDSEVALRISDLRVTSYDYSRRMTAP